MSPRTRLFQLFQPAMFAVLLNSLLFLSPVTRRQPQLRPSHPHMTVSQEGGEEVRKYFLLASLCLGKHIFPRSIHRIRPAFYCLNLSHISIPEVMIGKEDRLGPRSQLEYCYLYKMQALLTGKKEGWYLDEQSAMSAYWLK